MRSHPDDPGALYDLAASYRFSGRPDEALALLQKAATLRPDLDSIPAQIAKLEEDRGWNHEAAVAWRDYARLTKQRNPPSESVDRHVRMMLDRAKRLDEMASDESATAPSAR